MNTNSSIENDLDLLLNCSYAWLGAIRSEQTENLEKVLAQYSDTLRDFMRGKDLKTLSERQRGTLQQLLEHQKTGIKLVTDQKQQLSNKLREIRNGRNLKSTYNGV